MQKSLQIESDPENLRIVENLIDRLSEEHKIEAGLYGKILVATVEAVNNAIIHGNKSILEKIVTVTVDKTKTAIVIVIVDQGEGFNPDDVDNPIDDANLLKEVGRGIFIVKSLMDDLKIEPSPTGTRFTLTKNLQ